jgi:mannan endo-1,4-beta-mannosidase
VKAFLCILTFFLSIPYTYSKVISQIVVSPQKILRPISRYVYGLNTQNSVSTNATIRRLGTYRMSTYNWVINASNAGPIDNNSNNNHPCQAMGCLHCNQPGGEIIHFVKENKKKHMASLITLPLLRYVAGDINGPVPRWKAAPSSRFKQSDYFMRHPHYTLHPSPANYVVYQDEFVHYLVHYFKKANQGGIGFYALDDDPSYWPIHDPLVHPEPTQYWELSNISYGLAYNILKIDPTAKIVGPDLHGWNAFISLNHAPGYRQLNQTYKTFLDFYLRRMHNLSELDHVRYLSVLSLHWFSKVRVHGKRITGNCITPLCMKARMEAPRSLWDPTYIENSSITRKIHKPIDLIAWVDKKIQADDPGTKLAFTEYNYGADNNISGGIAEADVLGAFGKQGVYMANFQGPLDSYIQAAFQIFRNYNGHNAHFGNTAVKTSDVDPNRFSLYAATNTQKPTLLWILILNKQLTHRFQIPIHISSQSVYKTFQAYQFNALSSKIHPIIPHGVILKNTIKTNFEPLSVTLLVCHCDNQINH